MRQGVPRAGIIRDPGASSLLFAQFVVGDTHQEPLLVDEPERGQARSFPGLRQRGEIDVRGDVALARRGQDIGAALMLHVRGQRPIGAKIGVIDRGRGPGLRRVRSSNAAPAG